MGGDNRCRQLQGASVYCVFGYIEPILRLVGGRRTPPNPRVYQAGPPYDASAVAVNFAHTGPHGEEWIQTGYFKDVPRSLNLVLVYHESVDDYGYHGVVPVWSYGDRVGDPWLPFYAYRAGWDASRQEYYNHACVESIGNVVGTYYFAQSSGVGDAFGEAVLQRSESDSAATQIGRSQVGSTSTGYGLHLLNGASVWELWDSSLTAQSSYRLDSRPYYYHSVTAWW